MSMEKGTDAVIFDLYGTLLDLKVRKNPHLQLLKKLGLKKSIKNSIEIALTRNFADFSELADELSPHHSINPLEFEKSH